MKKKRNKPYRPNDPNRYACPNKLPSQSISNVLSPLRAAMINLRLGRGNEENCHALAAALMIQNEVALITPRHKHLQPIIIAAFNALNAIRARKLQRTIPDAPYAGTPAEVDAIDLGIVLYEAVITTVPGQTMRRAINRVSLIAKRVEA